MIFISINIRNLFIVAFRWGQLPALEVEGKGTILQSMAITRYLAKKYNLTGADDFEAAKCDEYVDAMNDLRIGENIHSTAIFCIIAKLNANFPNTVILKISN